TIITRASDHGGDGRGGAFNKFTTKINPSAAALITAFPTSPATHPFCPDPSPYPQYQETTASLPEESRSSAGLAVRDAVAGDEAVNVEERSDESDEIVTGMHMVTKSVLGQLQEAT
ncbi:hypothetical protein HDU96_010760, partial [Phlyctochytrium bullatum]